MLGDARKQISSLQAILAETHQHSQEAERRLHESEKKAAEKGNVCLERCFIVHPFIVLIEL